MKQLARVLVAAFLVTATAQAQRVPSPSGTLSKLVSDYWQTSLSEFPESATWLGDNRYNDRLTDLSRAAITRRASETHSFLARANAIDASRLAGQDAISLSLLKWELNNAVTAERFPTESLILDQLDGPQLGFAQLVTNTSFRTEADYNDYFKRLAAFPAYMRQVTDLLRDGIRKGWVQPNGPLRNVPAQIEGQLSPDQTRSPFYGPLKTIAPAISPVAAEALRIRGRALIADSVYPTLQRFRDFVRDVYLPAGGGPIGVSSRAGGSDYYAFRIRQQTTTELSAAEIHRIGLAEVARIHLQMDSVIRASGFKGTFDEFLTLLRTDPKFYYSHAEDLVTAYRDMAKRVDGQLPLLFAELPRNSYGVKPFPDFEAPSQTTARYSPGAADGSRAGNFMVNTYKLETRPKYEIEALTLHEAVPGHHLQISRAQELRSLPDFRRNGGYTAFVEGWALYAESLGSEMGFYADPYTKFGQLTYEAWRACRLVVDTGLHTMGWTREQAIEYMKSNTAKSEQDIAVEVDRYIVWPGQALAYKIGELKIKELRRRAERELGPRFNIRTFHNAVLDNGPLPLAVLEVEINKWIAAQRNPAARDTSSRREKISSVR